MKYNIIESYKYKDLERFTYSQLESDEISIVKYPLVLFEPFETDFETHGIAVLEGAVNSIITEEINGDYYLTAEILKDSIGKYTRVKPLCILKAQGQLFRIPQLQGIKDNGLSLKVVAKHISFDAVEVFNEDRRVNNQNLYETLSRLLEAAGGKYSIGVTDVSTTSSANFIMENFIESLYNKVLPRWGGELIRDNFKFTIKNRMGKYKPDLFLRYSKNCSSISRQVDYSQICTKIIPMGKNGITIEEVNQGIKSITSNKATEYPLVYTKKVKFDDIDTPQELKTAAIEYLNKHDSPHITVKVDVIDLEESLEYDNLKSAIRMNLGDTITVHDEDLGISEEQRVISLETDAVTGIKLKITLGEFAPSFADSVTGLEDKTEDMANKVQDSIVTSNDLKEQVVNNTTSIGDLQSVTENLNKDITATNLEIGQLPALETDHKGDLVGAINEVNNKINNFNPGGGTPSVPGEYSNLMMIYSHTGSTYTTPSPGAIGGGMQFVKDVYLTDLHVYSDYPCSTIEVYRCSRNDIGNWGIDKSSNTSIKIDTLNLLNPGWGILKGNYKFAASEVLWVSIESPNKNMFSRNVKPSVLPTEIIFNEKFNWSGSSLYVDSDTYPIKLMGKYK